MKKKQTYKYKYIYEWNTKYRLWTNKGGTDMLLIGTSIDTLLEQLLPHEWFDIYVMINNKGFRKIIIDNVRIYRKSNNIIISYERRCTYE